MQEGGNPRYPITRRPQALGREVSEAACRSPGPALWPLEPRVHLRPGLHLGHLCTGGGGGGGEGKRPDQEPARIERWGNLREKSPRHSRNLRLTRRPARAWAQGQLAHHTLGEPLPKFLDATPPRSRADQVPPAVSCLGPSGVGAPAAPGTSTPVGNQKLFFPAA